MRELPPLNMSDTSPRLWPYSPASSPVSLPVTPILFTQNKVINLSKSNGEIDTTITLLKRFIKKESLTQAHRSHYYQRAILAGFSHKQIALFSYFLMIFAGLIGSLALIIDNHKIIAFMFILLFSCFVL